MDKILIRDLKIFAYHGVTLRKRKMVSILSLI